MRKVILLWLIAFIVGPCYSQEHSLNGHDMHITMSNGANVDVLYNRTDNVLNVDIRNNPDEVEIIVTKNGAAISYDVSELEDDNINIDLSNNKNETVDIYIRNRKESQYIGKVSCK